MESGRTDWVFGVEESGIERTEHSRRSCIERAECSERLCIEGAEFGAGVVSGRPGSGTGSGSFGYFGADLCAEHEDEEVPQAVLQLSADGQQKGYVGEQGERHCAGV